MLNVKTAVATLIEDAIRNISGGLGRRIRYFYYKKKLGFCGENVHIDTGVFLIGCRAIQIGSDTHIDKNCYLISGIGSDLSQRHLRSRDLNDKLIDRYSIQIGENCHIAQACKIHGYGGVKIGDYCGLSEGVKIYSLTNVPRSHINPDQVISILPFNEISPSMIGQIVLCDNSWLGINVICMPGICLGRDSFVASNSIVLSSFGDNSYVKGDPAKKIGNRYGR